MTPTPDPIASGQESVWRYPRPAVAKPSDPLVRIEHRGILGSTRAAVRTLETSHPPSWYLPSADLTPGLLRRAERRSFCEWKGDAIYWHPTISDELVRDVPWSYTEPTPAFAVLCDHVAFYAGPFDHCTVDGEQVLPQPGSFYGGWITSDFAGPFKGVPGRMGW